MMDWLKIVSHSFWLAGLALVLAVAGYQNYDRSGVRASAGATWRALVGSGLARLGGVLFCLGMALTAGSLLEQVLWPLLAVYAVYDWWRTHPRGYANRPSSVTNSRNNPSEAAASTPLRGRP